MSHLVTHQRGVVTHDKHLKVGQEHVVHKVNGTLVGLANYLQGVREDANAHDQHPNAVQHADTQHVLQLEVGLLNDQKLLTTEQASGE